MGGRSAAVLHAARSKAEAGFPDAFLSTTARFKEGRAFACGLVCRCKFDIPTISKKTLFWHKVTLFVVLNIPPKHYKNGGKTWTNF